MRQRPAHSSPGSLAPRGSPRSYCDMVPLTIWCRRLRFSAICACGEHVSEEGYPTGLSFCFRVLKSCASLARCIEHGDSTGVAAGSRMITGGDANAVEDVVQYAHGVAPEPRVDDEGTPSPFVYCY